MTPWAAPCVVCGVALGPLCPACACHLQPAPRVEPVPGLDAVVSLLAYEGAARTLLHRWKFGGADGVLGPIAAVLASMLDARVLAGGAITWVPTSAARRRQRGRDQAAALAASLARRTGLPRRALLARAPGPAQTGRSRAERIAGPDFVAVDTPPAAVLLADDVVTTGATLASAAGTLRRAGALTVIGVTIARTPDRVTAQ